MVNEEFDKEMTVTGRTVKGTVVEEDSFVIRHLGLRERFIPSDSEEALETADLQPFGALKRV